MTLYPVVQVIYVWNLPSSLSNMVCERERECVRKRKGEGGWRGELWNFNGFSSNRFSRLYKNVLFFIKIENRLYLPSQFIFIIDDQEEKVRNRIAKDLECIFSKFPRKKNVDHHGWKDTSVTLRTPYVSWSVTKNFLCWNADKGNATVLMNRCEYMKRKYCLSSILIPIL